MGGAGILPVAIHKSKLYFLFGKENKYEKSAPGFSDFGGGTEKGETQLDTAIREGHEELSGFLSKEYIQKVIDKKGLFQIDNKKYRTFILPIKYDESLVKYFNNNASLIHSKLHKHVFHKYRIFEKQEIKWIPVDELLNMKSEFRNFYSHILSRLVSKQHEIISFIKNSKKHSKTKKTKQRKHYHNHSVKNST